MKNRNQTKNQEFEIYISDLKDAKRDKLFSFLKIRDAKEGNFDVFPIAVVPKPESGSRMSKRERTA